MSEASMNLPIYLDYNATTPVAPEVAVAMLRPGTGSVQLRRRTRTRRGAFVGRARHEQRAN